MNGLDELLAEAVLRLDDATGHLPIPRPPSPSFPAGRVALRVACALAIAGGIYSVAQRRTAPTAAELPPGFVDAASSGSHPQTVRPLRRSLPPRWQMAPVQQWRCRLTLRHRCVSLAR